MADKKLRTTVNTGINDKETKKSQLSMFDALDIDMEWQKEWQGMPEFVRGNEHPYQQHLVNYAPFKKNKLIHNPDVAYKSGVNNYGMVLCPRTEAEKNGEDE